MTGRRSRENEARVLVLPPPTLPARIMFLMKIVHYPHPALRFASRPLTAIDKEVRLVAGKMLDLMYEAHGLGLAANQVAWPFQLFVMNARARDGGREHEQVLINPVIVERIGAIEGEEGCLSFPELFKKVKRAKTVRVHAYDLDGKPVDILTSTLEPETAELTSRLIQHETDHLHGVLFIDKMGSLGKLSSRATLVTFERAFRKAQEMGEYPSDEELNRLLREQAERGASGEVPAATEAAPQSPEPPRI